MAKISIAAWIENRIKRMLGVVQKTDTATQAISEGKYVVWKDDLYKASADISEDDTLSGENLTAVSEGGLNELDSGVVHISGTEAILGDKSFTSNAIVKNSNNPQLLFAGKDNANYSAIMRTRNAGVTNSVNAYGVPQFDFIEYSPSSDGSSRGSYYERYSLPEVDVGRTTNVAHDIITTKTSIPVKYVDISHSTIGYLNDLTWTKSGSGKYYAVIPLPSGVSGTVLSVTINYWASLKEDDHILPCISSSTGGPSLAANTDTFNSGAKVGLRVVYSPS